MRREIRLERVYAHPPELVWRVVANRETMGRWLMPNDFEPVLGHRFTFRTKPAPGFDGIVHCEVLRIEAPRVLEFSWRGGPLDTKVTITLDPIEAAGQTRTRVVILHSGFEGPKAMLISTFLSGGWKKMLKTRLPAVLAEQDCASAGPRDEDCQRSLYQRIVGWIATRL